MSCAMAGEGRARRASGNRRRIAASADASVRAGSLRPLTPCWFQASPTKPFFVSNVVYSCCIPHWTPGLFDPT